MALLEGKAADAALALLPPEVRRQVHVLGTLLDIDDRSSLRQLVHVHHGDIEAYRVATIERVVAETRAGQRGPKLLQQQVQGLHGDEAADTVVSGLLIGDHQHFTDYCLEVETALGRRANPDRMWP